jgi:hypothetical protein
VSHRIWLINFYGYNFEDNSNFRSGRKKKRYELGVARWVAWKLVLADFPLFVPKLLQVWMDIQGTQVYGLSLSGDFTEKGGERR